MIVDDYKENGSWVIGRGSFENRIKTRAASVWHSMNNRCKVGSKTQMRQPCYIGCTVSTNFKDFQYFAEWCQHQVGYKTTGVQIDKDLLVRGNRVYSENTCVFLPRCLNTIILNNKSSRSDLPIGVARRTDRNKFSAACGIGRGRRKPLGYYNTEYEAFMAYKTFKESLITELANKYKAVLDSRAYEALLNYSVNFED